ncbi:MAG: amidohydrolase family protein [Gemmatimonadota bacterium]|nr:amidohydrolase family protein [Gemmatimonadota bacterium]
MTGKSRPGVTQGKQAKENDPAGRRLEKEGLEEGGPSWLAEIPKIDCHTHIENARAATGALIGFLEAQNMKWLAICYDGCNLPDLENRIEVAAKLNAECPERISWITSFGLDDWGGAQWESRAIEALGRDFDRGAVGVKVWKDIGMQLKDPDGSFVMIDNPRFDPLFDFVRRQGKTLAGHLIEPLSCWLPLESMTTSNDREYYGKHPAEHAFLHPEMLGHGVYLGAIENLLKKHPGLRVVICHLAGLESDVEALGEFLDKYPNCAVDTAHRVGHLQAQDSSAVRSFLIEYQDRILYGTDLEVESQALTDNGATIEHIGATYQRDSLYFSTDRELRVPELGHPVRCLALPAQVIEKIYFANARRWYPGI